MIFYFSILVSLVSFQGIAHANSLEEVDDKELNKLLNQEQYVAVLFSKLHIFEIYLFATTHITGRIELYYIR